MPAKFSAERFGYDEVGDGVKVADDQRVVGALPHVRRWQFHVLKIDPETASMTKCLEFWEKLQKKTNAQFKFSNIFFIIIINKLSLRYNLLVLADSVVELADVVLAGARGGAGRVVGRLDVAHGLGDSLITRIRSDWINYKTQLHWLNIKNTGSIRTILYCLDGCFLCE